MKCEKFMNWKKNSDWEKCVKYAKFVNCENISNWQKCIKWEKLSSGQKILKKIDNQEIFWKLKNCQMGKTL